MPAKRSKTKSAPKANNITIAFSYPDPRRPNETVTANTRWGIWLSASLEIYRDMLRKIDRPEFNGIEQAETFAELAFKFANIYLDQFDREIAREIAENPPTQINGK